MQYLKRGWGVFLKSHIFALVAGLFPKDPLRKRPCLVKDRNWIIDKLAAIVTDHEVDWNFWNCCTRDSLKNKGSYDAQLNWLLYVSL